MKTLVAVSLFIAATVALARPASAGTCKGPYVTVAWQMPSWDGSESATWPQTLATVVSTGAPNLGALDAYMSGHCGYYQVDVYYCTDGLLNLLDGGTLSDPDADSSFMVSGDENVGWKLVDSCN
jgi:hypothetical protein